MSLFWTRVETRLGAFHVASENGEIIHVQLPGRDEATFWQSLNKLSPGEEATSRVEPVLHEAAIQLNEFADGIRQEFHLPIRMKGTDFQKKVWDALSDIPYGETRSYADIAQAIGNPGAARAVGGANRANPMAPIVPCHRVIAADGGLGGYMGDWEDGGGTHLKRQLLDMERRGAPMPTV